MLLYKHENSAHYICVQNITLSADEQLIKQARKRATQESRTINDLFRTWLKSYVDQPLAADRFDELHNTLKHIRAGKSFSRDELNER